MASPLLAVVVPDDSSPIAQLAYRHPDLDIAADYPAVGQLLTVDASQARQDLDQLGIAPGLARLDVRSGRWETLLPAEPLIPGDGVGNDLRWSDLGVAAPADAGALEQLAWEAFVAYLEVFQQPLRLDLAELPDRGRVAAHENGQVVQIYVPRLVGGVPVRGSYLTAVINHGNLVLFGAHQWGDVHTSTVARVSADEAAAAVQAFVKPHRVSGWSKGELIFVPLAAGADPQQVVLGKGYDYRLAWVVRPHFAGDRGTWEALVDARSGEVLSLADTNHYATVRGGVLPVSNDGVAPDGVEQAGWPMPFATVTHSGGTATTDSGGNVPGGVSGTITSNLAGQYVRMSDGCGAISLSSATDINFGTSGGTDCTTPGIGGAGNTHASRTGFHELNRLAEMARGQLPANTWLQQQLTSNMNINSTCNAFWNGATVNFYRSGGGCANTGELAGVFDHEWGHGMDDNDVVPTVSTPGEGIADIYAALRLNSSCIGRNFRPGIPCAGYGDPCLTCTGVRDIDYAQYVSGTPHTFTWANANCGGGVHCRGKIYSESVWDLWHRDLTVAPFSMSNNTALEVVTRLTYIGAGNVGTWYSGSPPNGGCSATGGYLQYLAADDNNGNTADGTPHMTAIFAAFNRHQIACTTPTVQNSGCVNTPTTAPTLTASPLDKSASLSWNAVANATGYEVFRTDGVFGCNFGKVKVGSTAGTTFTDVGLQNGRTYSYIVIPKGTAATCFGPASNCASVSPAAGPNLDIDPSSAVLNITTGDGDQFLDNCETATLTFDVDNTGIGTLTNARIVSVTSPSHPSITINTTFPSPTSPSTIAQGASASGSFSFTANGLAAGDTVTFQVQATADQLSVNKSANLTVLSAESDFQNFATKTFTFESTTEGWQVIQGTFNRTSSGGGAQSTAWYEASSANLDNQCDHVRSPIISLTATSTLSLWNQFDIEPIFNGTTWYDRANVGIYNVATGTRTPVNPSGGRLYNASGAQGTCGTTGQQGWASAATAWAESTWSAAALGSAGVAGQNIQLDIRYGTDSSLVGFGFHFDQVTVTNFNQQVADNQSDVCSGGCTVNADCTDGQFCNGAEVCNAGTCQPGTPPNCSDGVSCTTDTCNEATDSCDHTANNGACTDGLFCNGAEICNVITGCGPGTAPNCNDGIACTVDSCNEGSDACNNVPTNSLCDNGLFCDGAETCNGVLGCQTGTNPCSAGQTCNESTDTCQNPAGPIYWMSFKDNASVPGVGTATDEDIVAYNSGTGLWSLIFDGSDVGLGSFEIAGLARLASGDLLLTFTAAGSVGGVSFDDSDVVRFTPTSLGSTTAGSFSLYFDGSDVGLTTNAEELDAIALAADGRLIVSSSGAFAGTGASGNDEDLFIFTGTLGSTTSGSFALYFDGSDVALTAADEDLDGATLNAAGQLLFSTLGAFAVTGASGQNEDVGRFTGTFGSTTSGTFALQLDLSTLGIATGEDVGSLHVE